jgi:hypothetical protein
MIGQHFTTYFVKMSWFLGLAKLVLSYHLYLGTYRGMELKCFFLDIPTDSANPLAAR